MGGAGQAVFSAIVLLACLTTAVGLITAGDRFADVDNFNDKTSAVRYCIPPGYRVRLYKDSNYSGGTKDLIGTGGPVSVNLNDWGFGDKTSAAQWLFY